MDLSTTILLSAAALLAVNRLLFVIEGWHRRAWLFWGLQLVNLGGACFMVLKGMPDFQAGPLRVINLFMAGLLVLHIVLNNRKLQAAWRAERAQRAPELEAKREAMLAKLKASDEPPTKDRGAP